MRCTARVREAYYIHGTGNVILCDIMAGNIGEGMKAEVDGMLLEVKAITVSKKSVKYAQTGSSAALNVRVNGDNDLKSFMEKSKYHEILKGLKGRGLLFEGDVDISVIQEKKKKRRLFGNKRI